MTSNFGGGAGDVYRIISYLSLLGNFPVLFNYYYLTVGGTFRVKYIDDLPNSKDIYDFIIKTREKFFNLGYVKNNFQHHKLKWNPFTILDSGSGNFIRDTLQNTPALDSYNPIITKFIDFCEKNKFDIMLGFDYGNKNTYKQNETTNKQYTTITNAITSENRLNLLGQTLDILKTKQNREFKVYAPIHGESPKDYLQATNELLKLEAQKKIQFDGIAIGGINKINSDLSVEMISHKIVTNVKSILNSRPIHVLAVGNACLIPILVHAGADTFDSHTPWRRASDGSGTVRHNVNNINARGTFSKILIPLLDNNQNIIKKNKSDFLKYKKLTQLSTINCDCSVCGKYTIKEIKKLYSGTQEDFHFAKILCYIHSINQHQLICKKLQTSSVEDFVTYMPNCDLKTTYNKIINTSKI